MQPAQELVRDKETLLAVVSGCKESAGAHLDYVQAALYRGLQEAVAAQASPEPRSGTGMDNSLCSPLAHPVVVCCMIWLHIWHLSHDLGQAQL